jgi:putative membrane protein insertion efficiency factor
VTLLLTSPAAALGIGVVRVYQYTLRSFIGANCRFSPSCSDYAVEALRSHGALRGGAKAGWRILRCNPWNAGGYDPVDPDLTDDTALTETAAPIGRD